ncbi:MAG: amidohydrolase [Bacteroidetes bacterium]|nr:amidohydrolase [Bacteroidota bacterium]MCH8523123.1 amidohydrolase [Balneolales bacterium]
MNVTPLIALRHELHRHPELAGDERETAHRIETFLHQLKGWKITRNVGGYGILAEYCTDNPGTHTVFRAELDALPIQERSGVPHASQHKGVAHLCGHDGHSVILCGLAAYLSRNNPASGRITLLFQPAEETGQGAAAMLKDKALADFKPDRIIALHNMPGEALGSVLLRNGTMLVASTGAQIYFQGRSAHAAEPEKGSPAWPAMQILIQEALSWPSTKVSLPEQVKITLAGCNTGGPFYGTAAGDGTVWLTLRAYETHTLNTLKQLLAEKADSLARVFDLSVNVTFADEFDATVNESKLTNEFIALMKSTGIPAKELANPYSYSEDFGRFSSKAPSLFFGLGAGEAQKPLHSHEYDFPDQLIERGMEIFKLIVSKYHQ